MKVTFVCFTICRSHILFASFWSKGKFQRLGKMGLTLYMMQSELRDCDLDEMLFW